MPKEETRITPNNALKGGNNVKKQTKLKKYPIKRYQERCLRSRTHEKWMRTVQKKKLDKRKMIMIKVQFIAHKLFWLPIVYFLIIVSQSNRSF